MNARQFRATRGRALLGLAVVLAGAWLALATAAPATAAEFKPGTVISENNMRDYDSMSAAQIQRFLAKQPGILDTLVTTDHAGVRKRASTIIWEACQRWTISPKVMLTMLQKEQSLLTRTRLARNTLSRAIGAGCPDGRTNRYPGFGKQMWFGAFCLDGYGEARNRPGVPLYNRGMTYWVYGKKGAHVSPTNLATYKLYVYNPSIGAHAPYGSLSKQPCSGNANFWKVYRKHFGDPLGGRITRAIVMSGAGAGGAVTPSGRQLVALGSDSTTLTFTPSVGYHLSNVYVDGVAIGAVAHYRLSRVKTAHTVVASFALDTFKIVPTVGPGGAISPNTTQTVSFGKSKTFKIAPSVGYRIQDVSVDGASIEASAVVKFTNVRANHTIGATFEIAPLEVPIARSVEAQ